MCRFVHSPVADGLFHAVGEVAEGASHALARDGEDGSEAILVDHDINVLRLQSAQNRRFTAGRSRWIEVDEMLTAPLGHGERRPGLEFIRMESAFQYKAAGDIPMQRLDVLLALSRSVVAGEVLERAGLIHPLACAWSRRGLSVTSGRHSVSTAASSRRLQSSPLPTTQLPSSVAGTRFL